MRKTTLKAFLLGSLITSCSAINAQSYATILHEEISAQNLEYMPKYELVKLKNEIVALKAKPTQSSPNASNDIVWQEKSPSSINNFLGKKDQANLRLVERAHINTDVESNSCSEAELFNVFLERIKTEADIPYYLSVKYLGFCFPDKRTKDIEYMPLANNVHAVGLSIPANCEKCVKQSYLYTFSDTGEEIASLEFEGSLNVYYDNIVEKITTETVNGYMVSKFEYFKIDESGAMNPMSTKAGDLSYRKFPEVSQRLLKPEVLANTSQEYLTMMQNEMLADYGMTFKNKDVSNYFKSKSWYKGKNKKAEKELTELEEVNLRLIRKMISN